MGKDQTQTKQTQQQQQQQKPQGYGQGTQNPNEQPWNDRAQRPMQEGDSTRPMQPDGTTPLDKDQQHENKSRPVQQNR